MMTRLQIEMLLHYSGRAVRYRESPAVNDAHHHLVEYGFLRMLPAPPYYSITGKGMEFVERLRVAADKIAKRLNKGNDVVKPALSAETRKLMGDFEAYNMFDVEPYTTGYGAPNWKTPPFVTRFPDWARGGSVRFSPGGIVGERPSQYSATIKVDAETGEKIKDFIAAAYGAEPTSGRSHIQTARDSIKTPFGGNERAWMTGEWVARFDRWRAYFTARGMKGAFHRRLMDMLFAKTDKLRDRDMCAAVSAAVRSLGPKPTYAQMRRAILDAERPK